MLPREEGGGEEEGNCHQDQDVQWAGRELEKENFAFLIRIDLLSGEEQGGFGEDDGQQRLDEEQLQLCHCDDHVL